MRDGPAARLALSERTLFDPIECRQALGQQCLFVAEHRQRDFLVRLFAAQVIGRVLFLRAARFGLALVSEDLITEVFALSAEPPRHPHQLPLKPISLDRSHDSPPLGLE
jgi:hypothetical protein